MTSENFPAAFDELKSRREQWRTSQTSILTEADLNAYKAKSVELLNTLFQEIWPKYGLTPPQLLKMQSGISAPQGNFSTAKIHYDRWIDNVIELRVRHQQWRGTLPAETTTEDYMKASRAFISTEMKRRRESAPLPIVPPVIQSRAEVEAELERGIAFVEAELQRRQRERSPVSIHTQ